MFLKQQLFEDMKSSIKSGDKRTLGVIRLAIAAIKQAEIDRREGGERADLDDHSVIVVLTKMVKQRLDSAEQYQRAGRTDLALLEKDEIKVIERYLPSKLNDEQVQSAVQAAIVASGAHGPADMGKVMSLLKSSLSGQADMRIVSARVKEALSH